MCGHIGVAGGVIDGDYRWNIGVILFNHSDQPFTISRGDHIAHILCELICYLALEIDTLDGTVRGAARFGSTCLN
jgi:dUTP pyrophosphatase